MKFYLLNLQDPLTNKVITNRDWIVTNSYANIRDLSNSRLCILRCSKVELHTIFAFVQLQATILNSQSPFTLKIATGKKGFRYIVANTELLNLLGGVEYEIKTFVANSPDYFVRDITSAQPSIELKTPTKDNSQNKKSSKNSVNGDDDFVADSDSDSDDNLFNDNEIEDPDFTYQEKKQKPIATEKTLKRKLDKSKEATLPDQNKARAAQDKPSKPISQPENMAHPKEATIPNQSKASAAQDKPSKPISQTENMVPPHNKSSYYNEFHVTSQKQYAATLDLFKTFFKEHYRTAEAVLDDIANHKKHHLCTADHLPYQFTQWILKEHPSHVPLLSNLEIELLSQKLSSESAPSTAETGPKQNANLNNNNHPVTTTPSIMVELYQSYMLSNPHLSTSNLKNQIIAYKKSHPHCPTNHLPQEFVEWINTKHKQYSFLLKDFSVQYFSQKSGPSATAVVAPTTSASSLTPRFATLFPTSPVTPKNVVSAANSQEAKPPVNNKEPLNLFGLFDNVPANQSNENSNTNLVNVNSNASVLKNTEQNETELPPGFYTSKRARKQPTITSDRPSTSGLTLSK